MYMFVCLPVCFSQSLPSPVPQLPSLSHSFSQYLWSQIEEAWTLWIQLPQLMAFLQPPGGLKLQTPACTTT